MIDMKEKLKEFLKLKREIENQSERLDQLNNSMYSAKTIAYGEQTHGGGSPTDVRILNFIEKKEMLENRIQTLCAEMYKQEEEIENRFIVLEPDERAVMQMRYLDNMEWGDIAGVLYRRQSDYSGNFEYYVNKTYRLHGSALAKMKKEVE